MAHRRICRMDLSATLPGCPLGQLPEQRGLPSLLVLHHGTNRQQIQSVSVNWSLVTDHVAGIGNSPS